MGIFLLKGLDELVVFVGKLRVFVGFDRVMV